MARQFLILFGVLAVLLLLQPTTRATAQSSVTIVGSFQEELGCPGDWQPDCATTYLTYDAGDDVWQGTFTVPAGDWEYKAALDDSWDENYGGGAQRDGPNISLFLASDTEVKFYYDHKTHWITDNVNSVIATVPGSYQSELGCSGDWDPSCLRSWLQDTDGDGIYGFTAQIPVGSYEVKVTHNESWAEIYGAGGLPGGPNIPFAVTSPSVLTEFEYDPITHILSIAEVPIIPQPGAVTIVGSFQEELSCPGDWQPDCATTHLTYDAGDDVWQGTFTVPAGDWEYKAALDDSWDENYGGGAQRDGPNISLFLASDTEVKFYYDHKTHWITDNVNSVIATVPGSYQSELGCSGDWDPSCLRSWLQDIDGDGIYGFTAQIPVGSYEAKVTHNESWAEIYGAGGLPGGDNIPFTAPFDSVHMGFSYDLITHILTISVVDTLFVPDIMVDPTSFDFGDVEVGASDTTTLVVENMGLAVLEVTATAIGGPDHADFGIVSGGPSSVPPGSMLALEVVFAPLSPHLLPRNATLTIESDDPDEPIVQIPLQGRALSVPACAYAMLADSMLSIDRQTGSRGDLHSNDLLFIRKGNPGVHIGDLSAVGQVFIRRDQTIQGDVRSGAAVHLHPEAEVTGMVEAYADVEPVALPHLSFTAGGEDVLVETGQAVSLLPGSYGSVTVEPMAQLTLSSGDYYFSRFELQSEVSLQIDLTGDPVIINVVGPLTIEKSLDMTIDPPTEDGSLWVTVRALHTGSIAVGRSGEFYGSIIAPHADVTLQKEVVFRGSICARRISLKRNVLFSNHSDGIICGPGLLIAQDNPGSASPTRGYWLEQNHPNPFMADTEIRFYLPAAGRVEIKVYNTLGQEVRALAQGHYGAGRHACVWDGKDDTGRTVVSGIYFYQLRTGGGTQIKRMILLK